MIALLWTALIIVALIAAGTFALVLVLARRLRAVVDRVNLFLPVSEGHLPDPGTPLPDFNATAVDGTPVSRSDIDGTAPEIVSMPVTANTPVYLFIDGYDAEYYSWGTYNLELTLTAN